VVVSVKWGEVGWGGCGGEGGEKQAADSGCPFVVCFGMQVVAQQVMQRQKEAKA
jgi:hypothetical protein